MEAAQEVYIKDEPIIIQAFKIALATKEKASFKYLSKYKILSFSNFYYYYEKFRNQQNKLKIREQRLGLDHKQNMENPTEKNDHPK